MDERNESFGLCLRRSRKARDLTQEQLAERVSCSRYTIRKIEADERRPSRRLAERLLHRLEIPIPERDAFLAAARRLRPASAGVDPATPSDGGGDAVGDRLPPWVGRGDDYRLLCGLLQRLGGGRGHVALVEGEPGIGKSRLAHELAVHATRSGVCTLSTRCYEIESTVPYQPVIDLATQAVVRASPSLLQALSPVSLAEIASLVPEVAAHAPIASLSSDFPEARQARLFRALLQLLDALAGSKPLLVIVDDLQWADETSAQFLHWLGRQATDRPLLVLYAFRDERIDGDERFGALVASLRAEPHARHLALQRLDLADTRRLLDGFAEGAMAERLHRETEGNPFFLVSMMQAIREGRIDLETAVRPALPDSLRMALRARLSHLPTEARPTLDVAAVLGRRFELDTLLEVTGEQPEQVLHALEVLTARRLLREASGDAVYDFTHDKLREVAYLEISTGRRVLLHREVAAALERAGADDARLAEHYARGHVWARALACMVRAGERSRQLFALRDALHWFDRALALAEAQPEALDGARLIDLHDRRGAARAQAGLTEGAVADFRQVIAAAREAADRDRVRDSLIRLGMTYRRADRYDDAIAALDEALAECRAMDDERHAADTLYHLGTVAWSDGRNREAIACHEEAVSICDRLGLADLVAVQAHHGRGEAHFNALEPQRAIVCYERSIALARRLGDKSYECENEMMVAYACTGYLGVGDYPKAEAGFELALGIARQADLQWHMGPTLLGLDHVRACTGRYGQAWTGMSETLRWLQGVRHIRYELMAHDLMGCILIDLGLHAEAVALLAGALSTAQDMKIRFWQPRIAANLAIASIRLGRLDVGPMLAEALGDAVANGEAMHRTRCLEALAELALAQGEPAACRVHADALLEAANDGGLRELAATARRWRGEALAAQGEPAAAGVELALADAEAKRLGRVRLALDTTRALVRLGQASVDAPHRLAKTIHTSLVGSGLVAALPGDAGRLESAA